MLTSENIVVLRAEMQRLQSKLAAERSEADARLQNSLFSLPPVEKGYPILFLGRLPTSRISVKKERVNVDREVVD